MSEVTDLLQLILQQVTEINQKLDTQVEKPKEVKPEEIPEPNYVFLLSEYKNFDWESLKIKVIEEDDQGPKVVRWNNRNYARRSPDNKYGPAIWFSRRVEKQYIPLIKFVEAKVDPVRRDCEKWV